ncbi:MAG: CPBP family intramembrane glutamic endopeptidase [Cyanobacteria bacterium P01_A01_bin.40]
MQNSEIKITKIRNIAIAGITCQFLPLYLFSLITPQIENIPSKAVVILFMAFVVFGLFCLGYIIFAQAIHQYSKYKGYSNSLYVYSILNIFGLAILFLLKNKNKIKDLKMPDPIERFSITSIFASYFFIPILIVPILLIGAGFLVGFEGLEDLYENNKNFATFSELVMAMAIAWYFFKQLRIANIDLKRILGSLKNINFKLPVGLAVIDYLFIWGINPITIYSISFIVPQYVENQLNYEYASTPISWVLFSISALIYAPIMEELFFRGIIFQKVAAKQGIIRGLSISGILFAVIHFRFDLVPLFIMSIISALLYFKTKQIFTSIIYHGAYNLIVVIRRLSAQIFSNTDPSVKTTVIEYQQHFQDNFKLYILLLAISIPYLSYFIYKNFPRKFTVENLPYFVNQERAS